MNTNDKNYDDETIEKAKDSAENYIINNYQDIKTVQLSEPYESPMGGLTIDGTVNGMETFTIGFNNDFTVGSISESEGFPELKAECIRQSCE